MSFREHLGELRRVLVRITAVLLVGFVLGWEFRMEIFDFLSRPITKALADNGIYHYQAISVAESVVVYLKSVLVADLLVFSPIIAHQLWLFVGPGLLRKEKSFLIPVTFFSVVFFLIGAAFAYTVIVPFITDWLVRLTLEDGGISMMVTMQNAYSVSFTFLFMFGLVFELPLVIYFLALFGSVTHKTLLKFFRYFVVLSFVLAAILTPPDPISQLMMAIPLNVLYAFGILVAWGVVRAKKRVEESRDDGGMTEKKLTTESVRILGGGLVLVAVAFVLIVAFLQTLPAVSLTAMVPQDSQTVVGYNPSVLKNNDALNRFMASELQTDAADEVLKAANIPMADVTEVLLVNLKGDRRVALVRHDGVGLRRDELLGKIEAAASGAKALEVAVIAADENTVVFGYAPAVREIASILAGEREGYQIGEFENRLLGRVQTSGPAWAWLPNPSETGDYLLSPSISGGVRAAGAWLQAGDNPSISFEFRAEDAVRADAIEARLDASKVTVRQRKQGDAQNETLQALNLMMREVKKVASPATRADIVSLQDRLKTLGASDEGYDVPFMAKLAPLVQNWAVRRKDHWLTVTTELTTDGVDVFLEGAFR